MTNGERLGNKLYELRKNAGLSQEELAEKLGVSRQAVSKWECGESLPDTDNLITISKLYGVSLDALVGNVPDEKQSAEKCANGENDSDEDEEENETKATGKKGAGLRIFAALPYPILVTVVYLLWGFLWDGWAIAWTLFVTIPVYHSIIDCIRKKRWDSFAYPVFVTFIYLFIGMQWGQWHPSWVIFITVPIYYAIAEAIDRR